MSGFNYKKSLLTFPKANKLLSNSNSIPKNKKNIPKPANPTPISKKTKQLLQMPQH